MYFTLSLPFVCNCQKCASSFDDSYQFCVGVVDLPLRKLLLSQQRADSYDDPYQILTLSFTTFSDSYLSYLTYLLKHMQWFIILNFLAKIYWILAKLLAA